MDNAEQREVDETYEFKFSRDLMRYVLGQRMKGLYWIPKGIFVIRSLEDQLNSPFTPQMNAAVKEMLDLYEIEYHKQFESAFSNKTVTEESHLQICRYLAYKFLQKSFTVKRFFTFCVILSKFAGYAYLFGIESAAEEACKVIIRVVRFLKIDSTITDGVWNAMQNFAENPDLSDFSIEDLTVCDESESTETADEGE